MYVTGAGIASTVAVRGGATALSLLLLPFASLAFASLFVDHHEAIGRIGRYLLANERRLSGGGMTWEKWLRLPETARAERRRVTWRAAPFMIFVGTSLAVLVGTFHVAVAEPTLTAESSRRAVTGTWGLGAIALLLTWHRLMSLRPAKGDRRSDVTRACVRPVTEDDAPAV